MRSIKVAIKMSSVSVSHVDVEADIFSMEFFAQMHFYKRRSWFVSILSVCLFANFNYFFKFILTVIFSNLF